MLWISYIIGLIEPLITFQMRPHSWRYLSVWPRYYEFNVFKILKSVTKPPFLGGQFMTHGHINLHEANIKSDCFHIFWQIYNSNLISVKLFLLMQLTLINTDFDVQGACRSWLLHDTLSSLLMRSAAFQKDRERVNYCKGLKLITQAVNLGRYTMCKLIYIYDGHAMIENLMPHLSLMQSKQTRFSAITCNLCGCKNSYSPILKT